MSSNQYGALFNNSIIDPSSGMHIYVLPISVMNNCNQVIMPYSKCMMLAQMYDLTESTDDIKQRMSCVSFRRFPTHEKARYKDSYNNVDETRKMIYETYATPEHTINGSFKTSNTVTDTLIAQFNRCLATEYYNVGEREIPYQPIVLVTLRPVENSDQPKTVLLYEALYEGIRNITTFWLDTKGNLSSPNDIERQRHSPQIHRVVKDNYVKMATTVELYRLQQKSEYVTKTIRDYSCLVIVKEYNGRFWAFNHNVNKLIYENNHEHVQREILKLAAEIRPLVVEADRANRQVFIYYLPALRAYSMNRDKLATMTDSFLSKWCSMFNFGDVITGNVAEVSTECVRSVMASLADVMTGVGQTATRQRHMSNLEATHRVCDFKVEDTNLIQGLISIGFVRVYFVNIHDAYFKHLSNGVNFNGQFIFQKYDAIVKNLAFTIKYNVATKLGQTTVAASYKAQIEQDFQVYQKVVNSVVFVTENAGKLDYISDNNVLGRVLLYGIEKNEKLISSNVTQVHCPLTVFAKMSENQSTKDTVPTITHSIGAITFTNNTFTGSKLDFGVTNSNNVVGQVKEDIENFSQKAATIIADRGSMRPSRLSQIPPTVHRNVQPHVADNIPDLNQPDQPSTSDSRSNVADSILQKFSTGGFTRRP